MLAMAIAFFTSTSGRRESGCSPTGSTSATRRIWSARNGVGLLVYAAAIALAFVSAPVSLGLCGLVAIYYLLPARGPAPVIAPGATLRLRLTLVGMSKVSVQIESPALG